MLVIQGLDDVFAPPENGRSLKNEYSDRVTLVELESTGHALMVERPDQVATALLDFLNALPDKRSSLSG